MNVLVFGATGGTGLATLRALLDRGHSVTAFVRTPSKLGDLRDRVRAVQGDVLDASAVQAAVPGHDAVVIALGIPASFSQMLFRRVPKPLLSICSRGTDIILQAMADADVRRVVTVTAFGTGESWSELPLPVRLVMGAALKPSFEDKAVQEAALHAADVDSTILRPVGLSDEPATGTFLASSSGETRGYQIPRADVGTAVVDSLENADTVGQTIALSS